MQTIDTFTPPELDAIVRSLPKEDGPYPRSRKWKRVDVGQTEVYVGDSLYVVALVEKFPTSPDDLASTQANTEGMVIKYLQSEGFLGEEYAYVGMQRFSLKHP